MKTIGTIIGIAMLMMSTLLGWLVCDHQNHNGGLGSVAQTGEYKAKVSTAAGHDLVQTGQTTLGSVTIVTDSGHTFTIWDATSTKDVASTTFVVFEASVPHGTYVFDTVLQRGLVVEPAASFAGDFVTTYR